MKITPLGDSALIVHVYENFASEPAAALEAVIDSRERLEAAAIPGVLECAPAYDSIGVFYNPADVVKAGAPAEDILRWLKEKIAAALANPAKEKENRAPPRLVEVPVCYEGEHAPDLSDVARHAGLPAEEVVRRHCGAEYPRALHWVPSGFSFSRRPRRRARHAAARRSAQSGPRRSVGIGGAQTGIYPITSPGGWNLIGRTPMRLFDPKRQLPALIAAGDRVQFCPISRAEFDRWSG